MQNIADDYKAITLFEPQVVTTDISGVSGTDVEQYNEDAMAILTVGATSGAGTTADVTIEGSDDGGSTYSTILTFGQLDWGSGGTMAGKIALVGITHVRVAVNVAGGAPSYALACVLIAKSERQGASLNTLTPDDES